MPKAKVQKKEAVNLIKWGKNNKKFMSLKEGPLMDPRIGGMGPILGNFWKAVSWSPGKPP